MTTKSTKSQTMLHRAVTKRKDPRLQPPASMPTEQAEVWRQVVQSLPAEWFSAEQTSLLLAYCNHVARAAQIQAALSKLDPIGDLETFDKLCKAAGMESARITMLARSMRLTQQSRLRAETASNRSAATAAANFDDDDMNELLA
jgi:hypothetical protein